MKNREFWIVRSTDEDLSAAGFVYVRESGHQKEIHVIEYSEYEKLKKVVEVMRDALTFYGNEATKPRDEWLTEFLWDEDLGAKALEALSEAEKILGEK